MDVIKVFFNTVKESFSNILEKISNNPIIKKMVIGVGIFIIIIIIIMLFASCSNKKKTYTYAQLEQKMYDIAVTRFSKKDNLLPQENHDVVEVSLQTLVNEGYLDNIQDIVKDNVSCNGNIKVINNYGYYLTVPYLNCGTYYKTKTLYETLINDDNIVTSGNGLYKMDNEYIFRGESVNNYLMLNGLLYRILRINEDGTIRVIDMTAKRDTTSWDDRFNTDRNGYYGINNYYYDGLSSRVKEAIEGLYNNSEIFSDQMKAYFVSTPVCVGKRSVNDSINDRTIECSETLDEYPFSLLQANEFYIPSLDANCNSFNSPSCLNYNYMLQLASTWTITADKDSSYRAYKIINSGISLSNTNTNSYIRVVTTLNKDLVVYSGTGSKTDPYVINNFVSKKK